MTMLSDEQAKKVTGGVQQSEVCTSAMTSAIPHINARSTETEKHYCKGCHAVTMQYVTIRGYVCYKCSTVN